MIIDSNQLQNRWTIVKNNGQNRKIASLTLAPKAYNSIVMRAQVPDLIIEFLEWYLSEFGETKKFVNMLEGA